MKRALIAIVIAFFGVMLAYAGGTAEQQGAGKQITIRFMMRDVPSTTKGVTLIGDIWQRAIDKYNTAHPGVKIVNESISDDAAYTNKLTTDIAAGSPPNIFNYPGIASIVGYAKNGIILNFKPYLDADKTWSSGFSPGALQMFDLTKYGVPGIYSIPYSENPEPFYYNKALFAKAGIQTVPKTWPELLSDIGKLNAAGIVPIGIGNKNTWRAGHLHTGIFYKYVGVETAVQLGLRQKKWTDPDVVATFQKLLDLKNANAFEPGFNGIDSDTEMANFISGKYAMHYSGLWDVGRIQQEMGGAANVGVFLMPAFPGREQYANNDITYPSQILVSGRLSKDAEAATMDAVKYLSGPEVDGWLANDANANPPRTDITIDPAKVGKLWVEVRDLVANAAITGHDTFAYDPLPGLEFFMKDQIAGMLGGQLTPEQVGANMQNFIDTHG
ncbi:MAG TPA: extracellular solute-binding protein [Spirochaetia bacterium]|nr:extracellular solute-binding protein [Spirochaetia bacterium]